MAWATRFWAKAFCRVRTTAFWPTTSLKREGRDFLARTRYDTSDTVNKEVVFSSGYKDKRPRGEEQAEILLSSL